MTLSPIPASLVRAAVPQDSDAIIDLVVGMFQDLGTTVFPDAWRDDLQQTLVSLGTSEREVTLVTRWALHPLDQS